MLHLNIREAVRPAQRAITAMAPSKTTPFAPRVSRTQHPVNRATTVPTEPSMPRSLAVPMEPTVTSLIWNKPVSVSPAREGSTADRKDYRRPLETVMAATCVYLEPLLLHQLMVPLARSVTLVVTVQSGPIAPHCVHQDLTTQHKVKCPKKNSY